MTSAAPQTRPIYKYVQRGTEISSDLKPPPGVAYDKVVNGKVVARFVLSNGVLARVLTKEQQAASDAGSAVQARNDASAAATKKANAEIRAAHAKHVAARKKLADAGRELRGSMDAFWNELKRVNQGLGYQDLAQDTIDYGLAAAGVVLVVVTLPVSGTALVVIGIGTAAAGALNAYLRPETDESVVGGAEWDDIAGLGGEAVGIAGDVKNNAVQAARYGSRVRGLPGLGLVGGIAGGYSAANNTSRSLNVGSWDTAGLGNFKGKLSAFKPTLFEKGGLMWEGVELENLEKLRAETEAASAKYDAALAEDRAATKAYIQTVVTWVEPKG